MSIFNKPLDKINEADLQALIENKVSEGKDIEYKLLLPGSTDRDKKEFLADISSFANASGGDIIYGVKTKSGLPIDICGLNNLDNFDSEKLRLEGMIRTGISPRIPGLSIEPIKLKNSNKVIIIIRIPKSWISPHMVSYQIKDHERFFSRTSNGKYPLDVTEIKSAFLLTETIAERIRDFRAERLSNIIAGETPIPLLDNPKIVLHIIPFSAFQYDFNINMEQVYKNRLRFWPINAKNLSCRHNFDGFLTFESLPNTDITGTYLQIFRKGIIEAVEAYLLRPRQDNLLIPDIIYEKEIINGLKKYIPLLKEFNISTPIFIMLSLLGVKGYIMGTNSYSSHKEYKIDRDNLILPEVIIENYDCSIPEVMKSTFDIIWNAAGHYGSENYDDNGRWNRP